MLSEQIQSFGKLQLSVMYSQLHSSHNSLRNFSQSKFYIKSDQVVHTPYNSTEAMTKAQTYIKYYHQYNDISHVLQILFVFHFLIKFASLPMINDLCKLLINLFYVQHWHLRTKYRVLAFAFARRYLKWVMKLIVRWCNFIIEKVTKFSMAGFVM